MRFVIILLLICGPARAQNMEAYMSLGGIVRWYNTKGEKAIPCVNWPILLYSADSNSRKDTARSETDAFGQFIYYGLPTGKYQLEIPRRYGRKFTRVVHVPSQLEPIVLPPQLPEPADTNEPLIRVESDYEKVGDKRYRFTLKTILPPEWKPLVKKVTYQMNHHTFAQKFLQGADSGNNFSASYLGWGCLQMVRVEVEFPHEVWPVDYFFCDNLRKRARARKSATAPQK